MIDYQKELDRLYSKLNAKDKELLEKDSELRKANHEITYLKGVVESNKRYSAALEMVVEQYQTQVQQRMDLNAQLTDKLHAA